MSTCVPVLLLGAVSTLAAAIPCAAESPSASASPLFASVRVAVIDVHRVFRSSRDFQRELDRLRADSEAAKQRAAERQRRYREIAERLGELTPGTPEYAELEAELEAERARYATHCYPDEPPTPDFMERETALYAAAFELLQAAVAEYTETHGIQLVLRASPGLPEGADRSAIMQAIKSDVVWRDVRDITDAVIELMEAETTAE